MKRNILFMIIAIISSIILTSGISHATTVIASPNPATVGQNVTINVTSEFVHNPVPPGTGPCNISTNFGDGSPLFYQNCTTTPCSVTINHVYITPGTFAITATAGCNPGADNAPRQPNPVTTTLTVSCTPLNITSPSTLISGIAGQAYTYQILTSGGQPPTTYSLVSGSLPPGLNLSSAGLISGTPTTGGNYSFTIRASDSCSTGAQSIQGIFSVTVNPAPCPVLNIASISTLSTGTVGQGYSYQLHTSGGQSPVTFSVISGSLPPGLNLNITGFISGTPTAAGNYSFTVRATDSCGGGAQIADRAFSITINPITCPALSITTSSLSAGTVGTAYSAQILTSGGQAPVTFSVISGSLPAGLNLSTTGLISRTPTNQGNYSFAVAARDNCSAGAQSIQKAFSIQIQAPPIAISVVPSLFTIPRGQSSSKNVGFQFTASSPLSTTLTSSGGSFIAGGETVEVNTIPLTVPIVNGSGRVSEVIFIPVRVIERTIQRGINRFSYIRTFTGPDINLNATMNFTIATEAGAEFDIKRIEIYFENRRAEITIERNYPNLKAYADIRFVGSGLLHGYWEVDGRVLSHVDQHLTFGRMVTLQTPEIPSLPTFDTGSHIVRFVITNPVTEIPLPSIIYFVTSAEFKGKQFSIKLISPEDEAALKYSPVKFDWEKLSTATLFLIQFFDNPTSKPIFSAYAKDASYALPEIVFKKIFSPGRKYYWKVEGFDSENNNIGESGTWSFSFGK